MPEHEAHWLRIGTEIRDSIGIKGGNSLQNRESFSVRAQENVTLLPFY